jgi:excisionase family DNA binding protein
VDRLLSVKELALLTDLPASWLYAKAATGEIPHMKLGKYLRFRLSEVEVWLTRHRRGPSLDRTEELGSSGENCVKAIALAPKD